MKQPKLTVKQLLNGIPTAYLEELADVFHSDLHSKKLSSRELFQLLIMGFLGTTPLSWRVLEEHYKGTLFQKRFSPTSDSIDHSSISERLEKIPIAFFEQLFQFSLSLLEKYYTPKDYKRYNIIGFNSTSTSVTLSAKLLSTGLAGAGYPNNSSKPWKQIKFSVGFNGTCAVNSKAFFEQVYYSEDIALAELYHHRRGEGIELLVRVNHPRRLVFGEGGKTNLSSLVNVENFKGSGQVDINRNGKLPARRAQVDYNSTQITLPAVRSRKQGNVQMNVIWVKEESTAQGLLIEHC